MTIREAIKTMIPSQKSFMDEEVFKYPNDKIVSGIDWDEEVVEGTEYELEVENFKDDTSLIVGLKWDGERLHIAYNQETQTIRRVAHFNKNINEYYFEED